MEEKTLQTLAVMFGCGCILIALCYALSKGINGTILAGGMALIGVLVGYMFGIKKTTEKQGLD